MASVPPFPRAPHGVDRHVDTRPRCLGHQATPPSLAAAVVVGGNGVSGGGDGGYCSGGGGGSRDGGDWQVVGVV